MVTDHKDFAKSMSRLQKTRQDNKSIKNLSCIDINFIEQNIDVSDDELLQYTKKIEEAFDERTINDLLCDCKNKIIDAIVNPLGLGRLISLYDKIGGNVDTIHNVRKGIYATKEERERYNSNEEYDGSPYHSDGKYRERNDKDGKLQNDDSLIDPYTGRKITKNQKRNLDHTISAYEIHNDPGRILAELDGVDLACSDENLNSTTEFINKSKKQKSVSEFIEYIDNAKEVFQKQISNLEKKQPLNEKQQNQLDNLKRKFDQLSEINKDLIKQKDDIARTSYDKKLRNHYHTSKKFLINTAKSSAYEGVKMGLQQAIGLMLYDLTNALFDEIIDVWKNGFIKENDNDWIEALKIRLKKIGERVIKNWKNVLKAFRDGAISGMLSNIVTVFVNTFMTTAKNIVRIIREGTLVLYKCAIQLLFPDKNKTTRECWDEALKILVAGSITVGGVFLQEAISQAFITVPFPFKEVIITICVGLATGVSTAIVLYILDKVDPFGAKNEKRRLAFYNQIHQDEKDLLAFQNKISMEYDL